MHLGHLLDSVERADPIELLGERFDLVTVARARHAADAAGESLPAYAQLAVRQFVMGADEEAWAQVVGRIQDGEAPEGACLEAMLRHRLGDRM